MVAVGGDDVVILPHHRAAPDGHGFLADVEMEETADPALLIGAQAALLEAPDAHHLAIEPDAFSRRQPCVDGRAAGRGRPWRGSHLIIACGRWRIAHNKNRVSRFWIIGDISRIKSSASRVLAALSVPWRHRARR